MSNPNICLRNGLVQLIGITLLFLGTTACMQPERSSDGEMKRIASEIDSLLNNQLDLWYPRVIDYEHGGYLSRFSRDWQPSGPQNKFIVTQARHVWSTSKLASNDSTRQEFIKYGRHGFQFLKDRMWDDQHGGFYTNVDRQGEVIPDGNGSISKVLYGNAFGLYGLAAYYEASGDTAALNLAKQLFHWLDSGSYDPEYGGYFNNLTRGGEPYTAEGEGGSAYPKDYNSGIHILEALAELYQVWPDEVVRERLAGMFRIVRDTFTTDTGYMHLYFSRDWTPVTYRDSARVLQEEHQNIDHITFGHDIETAFLLMEAAHALKLSEDSILTEAKRMVDHTIEQAWDEEAGGFFDRGYYFEGDEQVTITDSSKVWWAQAEALHSLLIMAERFPDDPHNYFQKFAKQWNYIRQYLIDREHGGWYEAGLDIDPEAAKAPKAHIWKGNYHTVRSLMRSGELLNSMAFE